MNDEATLLFANEAFYVAFAARDLAAMTEVWSSEDPLYCLHPGWPLLSGQTAVMESWAGILASGGGPEIAADEAVPCLQGDLGLVLCIERLGSGVLAASNLFRREEGRWRLFHHHAGPTRAAPAARPRARVVQ